MSSTHHHHDHDHDHDHGHDHDQPHPHQADMEDSMGHYQVMEVALRELLIEKGIITAEDVRRGIELMDSRSPALGAKIIARAWVDAQFKSELLADAGKAARSLGIEPGATHLVAVENTPKLHNVVVCTLCSCYPRTVLGLPPDWYKSRSYRSRIVREPRAVLREFGTELHADTEVRVHDSTADLRFLVLPMRPEGTEGWSEERLAGIVTRDSMIGVTVARADEVASAA
ncbi:MAG: nthA [Noviherbaspirillum sp.]|jgi:nitrile hydratase|nr:nthA [Noviherbaspirillum sp.]